ncbi:MAG: hypothetical protein JWR39_761 [Devosia sp.]|jgi:hypothetical protein|nr:hypothetical protein [Devosia sp.]
MTRTTSIAAALTLLVSGMCGSSLAQSYTLNGVDVPNNQVGAIQAHCDTLSNNNAPATQGQSGGATSTATTPEATAGTNPSAPSIGGATALGGNDGATDASNSNAAGSLADPATPAAGAATQTAPAQTLDIDVSMIDMEDCQAGGFTTGAGSNSSAPMSPTGAGAATTPTTN